MCSNVCLKPKNWQILLAWIVLNSIECLFNGMKFVCVFIELACCIWKETFWRTGHVSPKLGALFVNFWHLGVRFPSLHQLAFTSYMFFSGRKIARKSCGIRSPPWPRTRTWWWVGWVKAQEVRSTCPQSHPLRWGCHPRSRPQGCKGVQEELRASQGETRPTDHLQMHDLSEKHTRKGLWAQPICQTEDRIF